MKLSEILKDWPEKKTCKLHTNYRGFRCDTCYFVREENKSITSCDQEVDREALAKAMYELEEKYLFGEKGETWERALNDVYRKGQVIIFRKKAQDIISTMPTWLKRIEK